MSFVTLGAYSDSRGLPFIRKEVAEFIERRDGFPRSVIISPSHMDCPLKWALPLTCTLSIGSNPENIFLTDGASKAVAQVLNICIAGPNDGVRHPIGHLHHNLVHLCSPLFPSCCLR